MVEVEGGRVGEEEEGRKDIQWRHQQTGLNFSCQNGTREKI